MTRRKRTTPLLLTVAFVTVLFAIPAVPASATTGTMVVDTDTTLTEDHYGSIIVIASDVTLDCAGHSVIGSGGGTGIYVEEPEAYPISGVTVKDCKVTNFGNGIVATSEVSDTRILDNEVFDNNGIGVFASGPGVSINDNIFRNNGSRGIYVSFASDVAITGNEAISNGYRGIVVERSNRIEVSGNSVVSNGSHGVLVLSSSDVDVTDNTSRENTSGGIWLAGLSTFVVERNDSHDNGFHGLVVDGTDASVVGNVSSNNEGTGIAGQLRDSTVTGNSVTASGQNGIGLGGARTTLESNTSFANAKAGLLVFRATDYHINANESVGNLGDGIHLAEGSDNNAVVGNSSHDNAGAGISAWRADSNTYADNVMSSNGAHGLQLSDSGLSTVEGNVAEGNGNFGFVGWGATGNTFTANVANDNGSDGLHLGENSADNTLSGNKAEGNTGHGVSLYRADGNSVEGSLVRGSGANGVWVGESFGNTVTDNDVRNNTNTGYEVWASGSETQPNLFERNRAQGNDRWGFVVSNSAYTTVAGSHILQNGQDGIAVCAESHHTMLVDNQVVNNGAGGITVVGASYLNTVEGNVTASNAFNGVLLADDETMENTVVGNEATENGHTGFVVLAEENWLTDNVATDNGINGFTVNDAILNVLVNNSASGHDKDGSDGIYGSGFALSFVNEMTLEANTSTGNYHGFRLDFSDGVIFSGNVASRNVVGFDIVESSENTFEANTANHNRDRSGFELRDGSSFNSLVGNTADHNADAGFGVFEGDGNTLLNNSASHNKFGFVAADASAGNTFEGNYARNSWWDGADWSTEENFWVGNDFKWTTGI